MTVIGALFCILSGYVVMVKTKTIDPYNVFLILGMKVLSIILSVYGMVLLYMFTSGQIK